MEEKYVCDNLYDKPTFVLEIWVNGWTGPRSQINKYSDSGKKTLSAELIKCFAGSVE